MHKLGGAAFVLLGQAMQSLTSLLTGMALGRWAGQNDLGVFALGFSFCFLAISLSDTLVATPYTYFKSQTKDTNPSLRLAGLAGVTLIGAGVSLALTIAVLAGVESVQSLHLALPIAIMALVIREFIRRHLYVAGKLAEVFFFDVVSSLIQLGLVLILVVLGTLSAPHAFICMALACALPTALWIWSERHSAWQLDWRTGKHWLINFFAYGRWLVVGGACHVASLQLYPWLALLGGGPAQTGVLAACTGLTNLMNPLLVGLTNYLRPHFMQRYSTHGHKTFPTYVLRRALLFAIPALGFLVIVGLSGNYLLALIYGESYRSGATTVSLMAIGVVAIALSAPLQLALLAAREPVTNFIYHGTALALLLVLAIVFSNHLSLETLGAFYGGVNLAALGMLGLLFYKRFFVAVRSGD
ncbi:MAG TPA: hypothetical protein VJA19_16795 [Pseudomonas sp.]|nr:hypothetical protein [Pseudomonas sp.]